MKISKAIRTSRNDSLFTSPHAKAQLHIDAALGATLRRHRLAQGMGLSELATRCAITTAIIDRLEHGSVDWSALHVVLVCAALRRPLPPGQLLQEAIASSPVLDPAWVLPSTSPTKDLSAVAELRVLIAVVLDNVPLQRARDQLGLARPQTKAEAREQLLQQRQRRKELAAQQRAAAQQEHKARVQARRAEAEAWRLAHQRRPRPVAKAQAAQARPAKAPKDRSVGPGRPRTDKKAEQRA